MQSKKLVTKYKGIDFEKHNQKMIGRDLPAISVTSAKVVVDS
jgi:hypothetical protein